MRSLPTACVAVVVYALPEVYEYNINTDISVMLVWLFA